MCPINDMRLALLGDKSAVRQVTDRGELLLCPFCREDPSTRIILKDKFIQLSVMCFKCGVSMSLDLEICDSTFDDIRIALETITSKWNTRR